MDDLIRPDFAPCLVCKFDSTQCLLQGMMQNLSPRSFNLLLFSIKLWIH